MFTGIIQAIGDVRSIERTPRRRSGTLAHRLEVDLGTLADGLALGASVAVQGVCLTVAEVAGSRASFDVVPETWQRTTLGEFSVASRVHLERALRLGDPLDGHFVQGHVDGTGTIRRLDLGDYEWRIWIEAPAGLMPGIVPKGSIAIDGTSLTVVEVYDSGFSIALVPTTLTCTTFASREPGSRVNIETDILARLVVQRLAAMGVSAAAPGGPGALSLERLRSAGFTE